MAFLIIKMPLILASYYYIYETDSSLMLFTSGFKNVICKWASLYFLTAAKMGGIIGHNLLDTPVGTGVNQRRIQFEKWSQDEKAFLNLRMGHG